MPYPPAVPPATRVNTDPQFDNHPADHNAIAAALNAILAELGSDPSGAAADLTARLATITPIGTVAAYAGAAAPTNWLMANGGAVSRSTYAVLFGVIGVTYGAGDGSTTFNVPDLQTRVPVGKGTTAPFTALNTPSGNKDASLVAHSHTPTDHTHAVNDHSHPIGGVVTLPTRKGFDVNSGSEAGNTNAIYSANSHVVSFVTRPTVVEVVDAPGTADTAALPATTGNSTGGATQGASVRGTDTQGVAAANANMPPYIVLNYIIKALA